MKQRKIRKKQFKILPLIILSILILTTYFMYNNINILNIKARKENKNLTHVLRPVVFTDEKLKTELLRLFKTYNGTTINTETYKWEEFPEHMELSDTSYRKNLVFNKN